MKQYRPTWQYILKIFGLVVGAAFSIFILNIFLDVISIFIKSSLFEKSVFIFLIILLIVAAFLIIRANNPTIIFTNDYIRVGRQEIRYDQIQKFYTAKGGSEPYILTKEGHKVDLEISWFTKKDRIEIENMVLEKIQQNIKQL